LKNFSFPFLIIFFLCISLYSQTSSNLLPYYNSTELYPVLDYLINNGTINLNHPMIQPYRSSEIGNKIISTKTLTENHWIGLISQDLTYKYRYGDTSSFVSNIGLIGRSTLTSNKSRTNNRIRLETAVWASSKNVVMYLNGVFDNSFRDEESGFYGKTNEWIYGRIDEGYILAGFDNFSVFFGRMNRNLGLLVEPSLILSFNPFSYDHLNLNFENEFINFTYILSRLDDIYSFDIRDSSQTHSWNKRYLSLHRIDISFSESFKIGITEAALFGGKDQNLLFNYINPINIYFISQNNESTSYEESDANLFLSFDIFWKPTSNTTLFTQFFIDDIDFKEENRAIFPDRLGLTAKLILSDIIAFSQFYLTYNRISNWTYNSFFTWGNYTSRNLSIGYPKHGVENITLGFDYLGLPPFDFRFGIGYERLREQDLQSPFIPVKTDFPIGIVQSVYGINSEVMYFPNEIINASLMLKYSKFNNHKNIENLDENLFELLFKISIRPNYRIL